MVSGLCVSVTQHPGDTVVSQYPSLKLLGRHKIVVQFYSTIPSNVSTASTIVCTPKALFKSRLK